MDRYCPACGLDATNTMRQYIRLDNNVHANRKYLLMEYVAHNCLITLDCMIDQAIMRPRYHL